MASFIGPRDLPAATKDYFTDDNGQTHEANINRIAQAGLTHGCAPSLCRRNNTVSRAQMAGFLGARSTYPTATKDHFTDDSTSSLEGSINAVPRPA